MSCSRRGRAPARRRRSADRHAAGRAAPRAAGVADRSGRWPAARRAAGRDDHGGTTDVTERFSPGSYITLTDAEALNRPPFDVLPCGPRAVAGRSAAQRIRDRRRARGHADRDQQQGSAIATSDAACGRSRRRDRRWSTAAGKPPALSDATPLVTAKQEVWTATSAHGGVLPARRRRTSSSATTRGSLRPRRMPRLRSTWRGCSGDDVLLAIREGAAQVGHGGGGRPAAGRDRRHPRRRRQPGGDENREGAVRAVRAGRCAAARRRRDHAPLPRARTPAMRR